MAMAPVGLDCIQGRGLNGEETEGVMGGSEAPRLNCTLTTAIQGGKPRGTRGGGAGGRRSAWTGEKGGGGRLGMTPTGGPHLSVTA
jgi:hypothetical protein